MSTTHQSFTRAVFRAKKMAMAPSLDLALVRTFVTVAELSSFTGAAKVLGLSQSAVSLQIRRLEEAVGASLLHRNKREVWLTPPGESLMAYARRLLSLEQEALRSVRETPELTEIHLGIPDIYAEQYLPAVLESFKQSHSHITPLITCDVSSALVERFNRGQLDLCLSVGYEQLPGGECIAEDELVWVGAPDCGLESAEPLPLALFPEGCPYRQRALRALSEGDRDFEVVYVSQSTAAINLALERGWALSLRNRRAVDESLRVFAADEGLPDLGTIELELRVATRRGGDELSRFAQLLRETVQSESSSL